jgi:hypothetical protein
MLFKEFLFCSVDILSANMDFFSSHMRTLIIHDRHMQDKWKDFKNINMDIVFIIVMPIQIRIRILPPCFIHIKKSGILPPCFIHIKKSGKCFLTYSQQLHCFIFLVIIIDVIIYNSLDTILKFSAKKCGFTLHLVEMNPDPTRSGSTTRTIVTFSFDRPVWAR